MKTLGRIVIILCVFALVMGLTYVAVNAGSSTSSAAPTFGRDGGFTRPDGASREFHDERGGGGWMFGMIKNVAIIAVIVALVTIPKSIGRKRVRDVSASAA